MIEKELLKLQNGSDVRGIALEGIAGENVNLHPDEANVIAAAYVKWLSQKLDKPAAELVITIGHDSRLSATSLKEAALQGILSAGAAARDCEMASTPAMFMSIVLPEIKADGAIMITASHLPFNRNGLKFFTAQGGLEKSDITAVLKIAATLEPAEKDLAAVKKLALIDAYAAHLCQKIRTGLNAGDADKPLQGMHIVADAGNGAGGFFANKVLVPLGADISGSLYLDPAGVLF